MKRNSCGCESNVCCPHQDEPVKKKRKAGRGNAKGAGFERKICRELSKWWSDGERDDIFWRTQQSGGRATERFKKGASTYGQYGDITATDPIGKPLTDCFMFELKHGYSKSLFLDLGRCRLASFVKDWIEKLEAQAKLAKTISWLLIYKANRQETVVLMPVGFFNSYGFQMDMVGVDRIITVTGSHDGVVVMGFRDFLKKVHPISVPRRS